MSKAFTRESDDAPESQSETRPVSSLPPGARNYITPDGAAKMKAEFDRLVTIDRPELSRAPEDDHEARQTLQALVRKIHHLEQVLRSAVVSYPPPGERNRVRFGATVTVRTLRGEEESYRIVGVDETDFDRGWISWLSPLAKALLNTEAGQRVQFRSPSGQDELQILRIAYE
ncbi:MAG: transcription elongation factor GreB [Pedosphaera sp.]|nr:transcription elongation factor GreB [Pedosphaera sp.]